MRMTIDIVPPQFRKFVGMRPWIEDPVQRAEHMAFNLITECLAPLTSPFMLIARNGMMLCDATEEYLYDPRHKFGHTPRAYTKGTRQILEDYIDAVTEPGMDDVQRAIALSQSMHYELPRRYPKVPIFLYGESDEQTILKGGGHCSCRARLLCALCQVLGIPARPALMWVWIDQSTRPEAQRGGHTVAEIFLGGKWGFFDPQHHLYCRTHDGSFASIAEIRRNPSVFTDMPASVVEEMVPVGYGDEPERMGMNLFEYYWYKNFDPRCTISISRHDVNARHQGRWLWATPEFRHRCAQETQQIKPLIRGLAERDELTPEVYYLNLAQFRARFDLRGFVDTFAAGMNWAPGIGQAAERAHSESA